MDPLLLALCALASLALFYPLNIRKSAVRIRKTFLDAYIPFLPIFIIPYLALFPFIGFAILAVYFTPAAELFYTSLIFAALGAATIWFFWPRGMRRPQVAPKGIFSRIVAWTYAHDPRHNAFPSSHVFTAFLSSYYLAFAYPVHDALIWVTGSVIMVSTLFVKQHHLADVFAGLAIAVLSIGASFLVYGGLS